MSVKPVLLALSSVVLTAPVVGQVLNENIAFRRDYRGEITRKAAGMTTLPSAKWYRERAMKRIMKRAVLVAFMVSPFASAGIAQTEAHEENAMTRIEVIVDGQALPARLDDTPVGRDFAALLPLELSLSDYHGIEKVADLPRELDTTDAPASYEPKAGDITVYAPWGNLAIFYKPFQDSRGLVRLGEFDGPIDALIRGGKVPVRIQAIDQ